MAQRKDTLAFAKDLGNWAKNNPNGKISSKNQFNSYVSSFYNLDYDDPEVLETLNRPAKATTAMMQEP